MIQLFRVSFLKFQLHIAIVAWQEHLNDNEDGLVVDVRLTYRDVLEGDEHERKSTDSHNDQCPLADCESHGDKLLIVLPSIVYVLLTLLPIGLALC